MSDRCRHTLDLLDGLTDDEANREPVREPTDRDFVGWHNRLLECNGGISFAGKSLRLVARRGKVVCGREFDLRADDFSVGEVERVVLVLEQWARADTCEDPQ